jgi:signal transduction histidine kinase
VRIALQLAPDLPAVTGDRSLLSQAFLNLAVNGIQAMPSGGRMSVTTRAAESGVDLVVEDTGPGMSEDVAARCFDPFYTTKDVGEGTGMGLAVAHGIVVSHGGHIALDTAPGSGARFTIRLPRAGAGTHGTSQEG